MEGKVFNLHRKTSARLNEICYAKLRMMSKYLRLETIGKLFEKIFIQSFIQSFIIKFQWFKILVEILVVSQFRRNKCPEVHDLLHHITMTRRPPLVIILTTQTKLEKVIFLSRKNEQVAVNLESKENSMKFVEVDWVKVMKRIKRTRQRQRRPIEDVPFYKFEYKFDDLPLDPARPFIMEQISKRFVFHSIKSSQTAQSNNSIY